jgi:hypothetical protein
VNNEKQYIAAITYPSDDDFVKFETSAPAVYEHDRSSAFKTAPQIKSVTIVQQDAEI